MPSKDYYSVLGLQKDASEEDVKRAYKKMAMKWHPDKNPDNKEEATKKFKEIAEAYEILSDPEKRKAADRGVDPNGQAAAPSGNRGGARFTTHDPFEIFNTFFGGRDPFADFFGEGGFGSSHFGSGRGSGRASGRAGSRVPSPFGAGMFGASLFDDDDFFGGGFGSMGSFGRVGSGGTSIFMSSSMGGGGPSASGRTVTTTTQIVNGQKITRKVTQVTGPDGTVQETVEETTQGPSGQLQNSSTTRTIAGDQSGGRTLTSGERSSRPSQGVQQYTKATTVPVAPTPANAGAARAQAMTTRSSFVRS